MIVPAEDQPLAPGTEFLLPLYVLSCLSQLTPCIIFVLVQDVLRSEVCVRSEESGSAAPSKVPGFP